MPTYYNTTGFVIQVANSLGSTLTFQPSASMTTEFILSDSRLTKTADVPYYNPLINASSITVAPSATATYTCDVSSTSINCTPILGIITVFVNSQNNIPGITLLTGTEIINRGKIQSLIFYNSSTSSIEVDIKEVY